MKTKLFLTFVLALGLVVLNVEGAYALVTENVAATATVGSVEILTVLTKNVSNNAESIPAKTLSFGTISGTADSPQYIEVTYDCNETLWKIDLYTNNATADPVALPFQKAGLLKNDNLDRIPLYWCVYDTIGIPETLTLDVNGVPVVRTTDPAFGSQDVTDWAVMKDKNDLDDPGSAAVDESWAQAFGDGYCDIMYGSPSYSNLNAFPYYDVAPETTGTWAGGDLARPAASPTIVYVGAGAGFASAGDYSTTIGLDLYHE